MPSVPATAAAAEEDAPSPFDLPPPDEAEQLAALVSELALARGFTLIFAVCDIARQRERLMSEVQERLRGKTVLPVAIPPGTANLLDVLEPTVGQNAPDVVFVHGIESGLPNADEAKALSFVLNLNAARNHFPVAVSCPIVFWLPTYLLALIARGAPDFISVRSGVHLFPFSVQDAEEMREVVGRLGWTETVGLSVAERDSQRRHLEELLAGYEALPESERDIDTETSLLDSLVLIYLADARYSEGIKIAQRSVNLRRNRFLGGHPDIALSLNNLAGLYENQGRYAEAEPLYSEALSIRRATLPEGHPDIAQSLNNLAGLYSNQGKYTRAEPLYKEALSIFRKSFPEGHPTTAISMNSLASLYESQGRHAEAELLLTEALSMRRVALPKDHPNIANSLNSLACLYQRQGRYLEAESLHKEALSIRRKSLPEHHPDIAVSLNNLACLYDYQRRYVEAELCYKEAVDGFVDSLGPAHPKTLLVQRNYSSLKAKLQEEQGIKTPALTSGKLRPMTVRHRRR